jgi:hypothetical protein
MVRRLIQERKISYVKIGRYVRLRPEDVRAYRDANLRPAFDLNRHSGVVSSLYG